MSTEGTECTEGTEGAERPKRVVVVGAGAGGVELAFTLRERLRSLIALIAEDSSRSSARTGNHADAVEVVLVHAGDEILPGSSQSLVRRTRQALAQRGIEVRNGTRVEAIERAENATTNHRLRVQFSPVSPPGALRPGDQVTSLPCDLVVWVAGAAPHPNFDPGTLRTNERGFLATRATLQSESHDDVFAVGDCATITSSPTPKAGVYAVRQGPFLIDNLARALTSRSLKPYRPQNDFLALLNRGDGTALGLRFGLSFEGRWVMALKDRIDRRFMERFEVLDPAGDFTESFAQAGAMDGPEATDEMVCGGCAAKLEQGALSQALKRLNVEGRLRVPSANSATTRTGVHDEDRAQTLVGLRDADDIAAWRVPGGPVIATSIDAFTAFTEDPWLVGRAAANNALSDLHSKGIAGRHALALAGLPLDLSPSHGEELLYQLLAGAGRTFEEAGVELLGGHTTLTQDLWVGFSVDGLIGDAETSTLLPKSGVHSGDVLVLTKPLGTGVTLHAHMSGRLRGREYRALAAHLVQSNAAAGVLTREHQAHAVTDVTGFGLLGHLLEMIGRGNSDDSNAGKDARDNKGNGPLLVRLYAQSLPSLPGATRLLQQGLRSTAHRANSARSSQLVTAPGSAALDLAIRDLLFDPQTCGGLLISLERERAGGLIRALRSAGYTETSVIGEVVGGVIREAGPRSLGARVEISTETGPEIIAASPPQPEHDARMKRQW